MNELALNAVYLYSYNSSNFLHSKLFNMYGDSSFQTRWMFCRYFTKVPTTCQTPLPLVYSGATFSLSNYVINGLLKLQANHHHGERLTLPANLWALEKRDLYQSGRPDAWLGATDRESGPLIRTPNPILTDRFVFASPSVWPRSAGTRRSADMHRELPASRDWCSLTDLFKQNTIKPQKLACCAIQIIEIIGLFLLSLPNKNPGIYSGIISCSPAKKYIQMRRKEWKNHIHFEVKEMLNLYCFCKLFCINANCSRTVNNIRNYRVRMLLIIIDLVHCMTWGEGGLLGKEWIQAISASY